MRKITASRFTERYLPTEGVSDAQRPPKAAQRIRRVGYSESLYRAYA